LKQVLVFLVLMVCGILGRSENAWAIQDSGQINTAICPSNKVPVWPMQTLTKDEREARLRFFISTQQFQLRRESKTFEPGTCNRILKKLETSGKIKILDAQFQTQTMADSRVENILKSCPNLAIDKSYRSFAKGILDSNVEPGFDTLPESKKDQIADLYYQASKNMEFYDLSQYLGEGNWGYFAEAMLPHCLHGANRFCSSLTGYFQYVGSMGLVFNSKQCTIVFNPYVHGQRIAGVRNIESPPDYYSERPNFFAFIEDEGKIYRLEFKTLIAWDDFKDLIQPGSSDLFIDAILPGMTVNKTDQEQKCYFTSKGNLSRIINKE